VTKDSRRHRVSLSPAGAVRRRSVVQRKGQPARNRGLCSTAKSTEPASICVDHRDTLALRRVVRRQVHRCLHRDIAPISASASLLRYVPVTLHIRFRRIGSRRRQRRHLEWRVLRVDSRLWRYPFVNVEPMSVQWPPSLLGVCPTSADDARGDARVARPWRVVGRTAAISSDGGPLLGSRVSLRRTLHGRRR
jgi:hypothetical protein